MCELFGSSTKEEILVNRYLKQLKAHSTDHPHGWGMAVFHGEFVNLEKEPKAAVTSDYLKYRLEAPIFAESIIAHIRLATRGEMNYINCHPFTDRDKAGKTWTMAHNGTIFESELLDTYRTVQKGSTDSERILCHIMKRINEFIEKTGEEPDPLQRFTLLDEIIQEITPHNKVNLMIYDGEFYYVHTNMKETLYYKRIEEGILFSTTKLDPEGWEQLPMMQLFAFHKGELIYQGTKHNNEYGIADPDGDHEIWSGL